MPLSRLVGSCALLCGVSWSAPVFAMPQATQAPAWAPQPATQPTPAAQTSPTTPPVETASPATVPVPTSAPEASAPAALAPLPEVHPAPPVVETPAVAPYVPAEPPTQAGRGFVVGAALGTAPQVLATSTGTLTSLSEFGGSLSVGFKHRRVVLTIALDISSVEERRTFSTQRSVNLLVVPTLQVALLRSRDLRTELILNLRLGAGAGGLQSGGSTTTPPASILVYHEVGAGVRYWLHPQFALHVLAGYGGQWVIGRSSSASTETLGAHGVAASLGAIGVF